MRNEVGAVVDAMGCKYLDPQRALQHLQTWSTSVFVSLHVGVPLIFTLNKVFHTETNGEKCLRIDVENEL